MHTLRQRTAPGEFDIMFYDGDGMVVAIVRGAQSAAMVVSWLNGGARPSQMIMDKIAWWGLDMSVWLLIVWLGASYAAVPGIVDNTECQRLGQQLQVAEHHAYRCIPYKAAACGTVSCL